MTSPLTRALAILAADRSLTAEESAAAVTSIITGEASEAAIAALLTALRFRGETAAELLGAVRAVRQRMVSWDPGDSPAGVLDTCGTGGDGAGTVNISTAAAIVVAACGVPVAKHGNRSATGNSGSAEVLSALGIDVEAAPSVVRRCLTEAGLTFLFAPKYHPAMKYAAAVRRQLPFRTLFNLVGPLANPVGPAFQLIGVPGIAQASLIARTLADLEVRRAAVVTGSDGLDEVTLDGPTHVRWVVDGEVSVATWQADEFGLPRVHAREARVDGPEQSARHVSRMLEGEGGPVRSLVLANAAAALLVAGVVDILRDGVARSAAAIDSGDALRLLQRWRELSRGPA